MLVVAISSRALFNIEDGNAIFENEGWDAFVAYMRKNETRRLRPGVAFPLVQKLLSFNSPGVRDKVEVILLSSSPLEAGARVLNSIQHYGLDIERAYFTAGGDRFKLARASNVTLFLSTNAAEVSKALAAGMAAATVMPTSNTGGEPTPELRLAFDGDSVLFSDEAERVNEASGLAAFTESEQRNAKIPLGAGPFKPVLQALRYIQEGQPRGNSMLRIALVTARGVPAYARVLKTFRTWGVEVDEAFFCGGRDKGPILDAFGADLFFDDGLHNIASAVQFVPAGHVPNGVLNQSQISVDN